MMKKKPQRTCVACRQTKPKKELIRVVKDANGNICVDATGKASGRGAYICPNIQCVTRAYKNKALERALKTKIEDEIYNELKEYCEMEVKVNA